MSNFQVLSVSNLWHSHWIFTIPSNRRFFIKTFEVVVMESSECKPKVGFRYVGDTFTIWPHRRDSLQRLFENFNSQDSGLQLTMELESNNSWSFLGVLVTRQSNDRLGHLLNRKSTPTHRCLYVNPIIILLKIFLMNV